MRLGACRRLIAAVAVAAVAGSACTTGGDGGDEQTPSPSSSPSSSESASPDSSESQPGESDSSESGSSESGAASAAPLISPEAALLSWQREAGSVRSTVTRAGDWTLSVSGSGSVARISGGADSYAIRAGRNRRISDTAIDGRRALVVAQDRQEQRPSRAVIIDLGTGVRTVLDGRSTPPTVNGGTWALRPDGTTLHATTRSGDYCLAEARGPRDGRVLWCARPRHGFSGAQVSDMATTLLTFDDQRPSCRTPVVLREGGGVQPLPKVTACKGWDSVVTESGQVWSEVTKESRVETGRFQALDTSGEVVTLGPGLTGSLVWCAGAAYFSQDPRRDDAPARVLRWSGERGLEVVYRSPAGSRSALSAPRCGGSHLTISLLSESGDAQLSAALR